LRLRIRRSSRCIKRDWAHQKIQGLSPAFLSPVHSNQYSASNANSMAIIAKGTLYFRGNIHAEDEIEIDVLDFDKLLKFAEKFPVSIRKRILDIWDTLK
jgi:hypothetical protein